MSSKWTDEQLQAINERGRNILVSAGAGSGKTAVMVERVVKLVMEDRVPVSAMLIVTFTKAAASEMKERLRKSLTPEAFRITVAALRVYCIFISIKMNGARENCLKTKRKPAD